MPAHRLEDLPVYAQLWPLQLSWAQAPHPLGARIAHPHVPAVPSAETPFQGQEVTQKLEQPLLLQRTQVQSPAITPGDSQQPGPPAPED